MFAKLDSETDPDLLRRDFAPSRRDIQAFDNPESINFELCA
jgi:hypothetical protein